MSNDRSAVFAGGCVFLGLCLLCGGCGLGCIAGGIHYSDGYRDGQLQKVSEKGLVWTTTEAELALPGIRTVGDKVSNTFEFTVPTVAVRDQLSKVRADQLVRVHYQQYLFSPPWRGDTAYRATRIEVLDKQLK